MNNLELKDNCEIVEILSSGILVLRNCIPENLQLEIIKYIMNNDILFKDKNSNWNYVDKRGNSKGRYYSKIDNYPDFLINLSTQLKSKVEILEPMFTYPPFTHVLTMLYPDKVGMGWHSDSVGGHDGDEASPIYSLSLGNDALFQYTLIGGNKNQIHKVLLKSGDLLVFGGPQRHMKHNVKEVYKGSFNKFDFDSRINFTFRTCTDLSEDEYIHAQTFIYNKD